MSSRPLLSLNAPAILFLPSCGIICPTSMLCFTSHLQYQTLKEFNLSVDPGWSQSCCVIWSCDPFLEGAKMERSTWNGLFQASLERSERRFESSIKSSPSAKVYFQVVRVQRPSWAVHWKDLLSEIPPEYRSHRHVPCVSLPDQGGPPPQQLVVCPVACPFAWSCGAPRCQPDWYKSPGRRVAMLKDVPFDWPSWFRCLLLKYLKTERGQKSETFKNRWFFKMSTSK